MRMYFLHEDGIFQFAMLLLKIPWTESPESPGVSLDPQPGIDRGVLEVTRVLGFGLVELRGELQATVPKPNSEFAPENRVKSLQMSFQPVHFQVLCFGEGYKHNPSLPVRL